ncbi:MAG: SUMF1/EgtB/PvdO family nonheme iron enzyme, partial [Xanthobacteraceae bacterium]
MQRWFLSFHSPDQALAERLKAAIERKDSASRVFVAPMHLRAGGSWSAQLAQEIADATAFILLVGEHGLGDWQVLEYDEALEKRVKSPDFPLVIVLLEGQTAPGLPFLRRLHWIISRDPTSEMDVARIFDGASGSGSGPGELWRYTSPYRGLAAMEDKDSDYFFGRKRETVEVLSALACAPDRLPVLIGNSGVGKSSLAQAGVLASLKRQAWPEGARAPNEWPTAFKDSRQWYFLSLKPGTEPLKALVQSFLDTWQFNATDPERVKHQNGWVELLREAKATLPDLIEATERRRKELDQPKPPGFFLYIDQGEELYVRAEEHQRQRFSELLAQALPDPRLRAMMSLRSDFLGHLQNDERLFNARQQIDVPPLREAELHEIISRPAQLLAARFETEGLVDIITRRAAEDSIKDIGSLPLLSYTLDDMWTQMVRHGDGTLRLPAQSFELGGVLVDRANKFLEKHPGAENALRRILTLRLATVRDDGEPTRRRASRGEFSPEEWRLVSELADYPNRLLVTVASETGDTYAEVAHEAIFRRWEKLREWIAAEREFLAWRSGLEAAHRAWQDAPDRSKDDALLMGFALAQAQSWLAKRSDDIPEADGKFIVLARKAAQRRRLRAQALVGALAFGIVAALVGWFNQSYLQERWRWFTVTRPYMMAQIRPYVLTATEERALGPTSQFKECAKDCPEMIVVPAGPFMMGSSASDMGNGALAQPVHIVTIGKAFAVSKFEVTFADWDACAAHGDCDPHISDDDFGRGPQPVINVNWDDAQRYVAWLSKMTG